MAGVSVGFAFNKSAIVPDTCGVAIDVPLNVAYPPDNQEEKIATPGAAIPWSATGPP